MDPEALQAQPVVSQEERRKRRMARNHEHAKKRRIDDPAQVVVSTDALGLADPFGVSFDTLVPDTTDYSTGITTPLSLLSKEEAQETIKTLFAAGNIQKRRHRIEDSVLTELAKADTDSKEAKQLKRILRNRESANRHRLKKQEELKIAQDEIQDLKSRISQLENELLLSSQWKMRATELEAENANLRTLVQSLVQ
eukprot:TRINITY_DN19559_c0_g1::TRINITY_DN19559_c0_g1_i1::g.24515::m.24515 TRINITY_DN19559_c0_g1::TRINITY_DN19559_c0_g1_i1::g.24515  ORF type:complete len:196 (-),score=35.66,bZIP_2/PF07716.10/71,bZIP_2/PF07716.10/2.5e-05,bZIP_2/PF07716.10/0.63,bZIP_1/PF00170.16/6.1e+02,bZIP_1/PF00170.16/2.8e-05,bZIP_1/PF00170.16/24,AAA_23/PF13476.1/0.006,Pfg27/PF09216.5/0.032,WD40_alt/PF14077.1/9.1,WD40_alt/PF14077.1/9.6,Pox_A_type_inc/PF04508.7/8.5e+03,Pox_A_type_inc/PF04508.7/1.5e+04,Pox_A_type_inc/PF04508.7/6.2e+03,P